MSEPGAQVCLWCSRHFVPRRGGSPQRFCKSRCRTAFWSALRRWGERAVAAGVLTVPDIRNGAAAACTLVSGGTSSAAISPAQKPTLAAPVERPDEAAGLIEDLLGALLDLPGWSDTAPTLWTDIALALPDKLFYRIDRYLEARFVGRRVTPGRDHRL